MKDNTKALARLKIIENEAKALWAEIEAPEQKYYKGQPVLVRDNDDCDWNSRALKEVTPGLTYPFKTMDGNLFTLCKPDTEAPSLLNWIEHDGGSRPVDSNVVVIFDQGTEHPISNRAGVIGWGAVKRYAIIPEIEWL